MAAQDDLPTPQDLTPTPATPQVLYLDGLPRLDGSVPANELRNQPGPFSITELRIDPTNPNRAEAVIAPGADGGLVRDPRTVEALFNTRNTIEADHKFIHVQEPAIFERTGETWRLTQLGQVEFSNQPQQAEQAQLTTRANELAADIANTTGPIQRETEGALESIVAQIEQGPNAGQSMHAENLRDEARVEVGEEEQLDEVEAERQILRRELDEELAEEAKANRAADLAEAQQERLEEEQAHHHAQEKSQPEKEEANIFYIQANVPANIPEGVDTLPHEKLIQDLEAAGASVTSTLEWVSEGRQLQTMEVKWPKNLPEDEFNVIYGLAKNSEQWGAKFGPKLEDGVPVQYGRAPEPVPSLKENAQAATPAPSEAPTPQVAAAAEKPAPAQDPAVGQVQVQWKQKGDEVAPMLEMRAYLAELKDAGVAVGALRFEKGADGKLSAGFAASYDPKTAELGKLEGALQGLKKVGNGVEIKEPAEQALNRSRDIGPTGKQKAGEQAGQVAEAFGVKQWDALSAALSNVPKQVLSAPEQAQQAAGTGRVQQVAQQQGKVKEEVLREGKGLFDIDTDASNPASAFLKNFYAQLNGAPKTRQHIETDYEKTRQELENRLNRQAGPAVTVGVGAQQVAPAAPAQRAPAPAQQTVPTQQAPTAAATQPAPAQQTPPPVQQPAPATATTPAQDVPRPGAPAAEVPVKAGFTEKEVPQKLLTSLGITLDQLRASGELNKLLSGEKTGLLKLEVAGTPGQEPVKFDAKMVLTREANGTATLQMELPQKQLVIPQEVGGQALNTQQRERLQREGTAGLVHGLKDAQGQQYNGYVGVDKEMNRLVVLPENKVKIQDMVAGVRLSDEQSKSLREGNIVQLAGMKGKGGASFDGTAQINAGKGAVEIRPLKGGQPQQEAPKQKQNVTLETEKTKIDTPKPQVRPRGPRVG